MTSDIPDGKLPANGGRRKNVVTSLLTFNGIIKHGGWALSAVGKVLKINGYV